MLSTLIQQFLAPLLVGGALTYFKHWLDRHVINRDDTQ